MAKASQQTKPQRNDTKIIVYGVGGFLLLIVVLLMFSCGPRQGTMMFGICRTFLDLHVPYPETVQHRVVEQYPQAVRIYYTQTDAFGEYTQQMMECAFRQDPQAGWQVDKVLLNRTEMDETIITDFNRSLPAIVAAEPDLSLPPRMPTNIKDLR